MTSTLWSDDKAAQTKFNSSRQNIFFLDIHQSGTAKHLGGLAVFLVSATAEKVSQLKQNK